MLLPPLLEPEVITGDTSLSPPVATTDAATIDEDATTNQGAGGMPTMGPDGIHHDNRRPALFPKAAAGEDNTGDDEMITKRKPASSTENTAPILVDSAAATAAAASHGGGEAAACPANRGQLSSTTGSQRETPAMGNNHGWHLQFPGERQQQLPGAGPFVPPPLPTQLISSISNDEEIAPFVSPLELEATPVQNVEATLSVPNNEPVYEATLLSRVDQADQPWLKRHKPYIIGVIALVSGAVAGAMGGIFSGGNDGDGVYMPTSELTPMPTWPPTSPTASTTPSTSPPTSTTSTPASTPFATYPPPLPTPRTSPSTSAIIMPVSIYFHVQQISVISQYFVSNNNLTLTFGVRCHLRYHMDQTHLR